MQIQEEQASGHTLETVSPGQIPILNQNPHLKHGGVSKCHFGIQHPSTVLLPLSEKQEVWALQCVAFGGGFFRVEHFLKHVQEKPTFLYQVEIS